MDKQNCLRPTIVAIDDDQRNLSILEEILDEDYDVYFASCPGNALEMIAKKKLIPEIFLVDIMMPGMNGYEFTQYIRHHQKLSNAKIILISGKAMVEERLKGYELGADDYITKPFIDDELLAKIRVYERLISAEKQLQFLNNSLQEQVNIRSQQLMQAEKMTFLGGHIAEIIHNLKNPLTIIAGYTDLLLRKDPDNMYG
ncbi:MAG: response regulator, partial [Bacteriovoracia bacterium]